MHIVNLVVNDWPIFVCVIQIFKCQIQIYKMLYKYMLQYCSDYLIWYCLYDYGII